MGENGAFSSVDDQTITGQGDIYSVGAGAAATQRSGQRDIPLGQVHIRQDIDVTEDERWARV